MLRRGIFPFHKRFFIVENVCWIIKMFTERVTTLKSNQKWFFYGITVKTPI